MNSAICMLCVMCISMVNLTQVTGREIRLKLSASGLPNLDPFDGKPDPYAIVHYSYTPTEQYIRFGKTDWVQDVNSVEWPETFTFEYVGEESQQRIKIDVMDYDPVDEDDYIGYVEFKLKDVAAVFGMTLDLDISPNGNGKLRVVGEML